MVIDLPVRLSFFLMPLLLILAGCAPGIIYTDITTPLTVDMDGNLRGSIRAERGRQSVKEPLTRLGLRAEWSGYAIGQAAKEAGFSAIRYADLRHRSVIGGLWESQTVIVYGERREEE